MLLLTLSPSYLFGIAGWIVALSWMLRRGLIYRRFRKSKQQSLTFVNLLLSGWFVLVALTLPEVWSALFVDQSDAFNMTNISQRWFQRHVVLNPQGFRDSRPFQRTVPEGQRRIAFLGDSFTFGHGVPNVEDRFSDRVARNLDEKAAGEFVVNNLGVPGHGMNDIKPLWEKVVVADDAQVDIAIYSLCLNDIEWFSRENLAENEKIQRLKPENWFLRDTYFYNTIYFRVQLLRQPRLRNYYEYVETFYRGTPWDRMKNELAEVHQTISASGTDFRLVIFPFLHNLGPQYPFREAHAKIVAFAQSQQIPVLDLEPVLAPHVAEGLVVNRFDPHPNSRAHELAAAAMIQDLLRDLVQPLDQKPRKL